MESKQTACSPESFHLLVTDSNHHVGDLLLRELEKEGYTVCNPKSANSAFEYLRSSAQIDLVIFDPQLFHPFEQTLLGEILRHHPDIRIILHTYKDILRDLKAGDAILSIEKNAESIGPLKNAVHTCFLVFSEKQARPNV